FARRVWGSRARQHDRHSFEMAGEFRDRDMAKNSRDGIRELASDERLARHFASVKSAAPHFWAGPGRPSAAILTGAGPLLPLTVRGCISGGQWPRASAKRSLAARFISGQSCGAGREIEQIPFDRAASRHSLES